MIHLIFSLLLSGSSFFPVPVVSDLHSTAENVKSALNDYLEDWDPETTKRLVVSQKEQKLYLFHQNTLLAVFPVSTGRNGYTPDGVYRIYYKKSMVRYREGDGMPFWMEFKPKFGFHGLPFDKDGVSYGAEDLGKPASAGCVRLDTVNAGLVYQVTPSHSLVVIQQEPPSY
ncbi:L,D-transpeptidase [Myxococcota bacterium]|nr:L,D-transpeptidase [Myxococcota bacterium]